MPGTTTGGMAEIGEGNIPLGQGDGAVDLEKGMKEMLMANEPYAGSTAGQSVTEYMKHEEEKARQRPAPPLYDEEIGIYTHTAIHEPRLAEALEAMYRGEMGPNDLKFVENDTGPSLMHIAALAVDVPLMRALLHRGIDIDKREPVIGSPVTYVCNGIVESRDLCYFNSVYKGAETPWGSRVSIPSLKGVEFLLSVGADPDFKLQHRSEVDGELLETTSLIVAAGSGCRPVCELLIKYKADVNYRDTLRGETALEAARLQELHDPDLPRWMQKLAKKKKPPRECPCGSEELYEKCHGAPDGVPVHPRMPCPCKTDSSTSKHKMYKDCCLKRKFFIRETLTKIITPLPTINTEIPEHLGMGSTLAESIMQQQGLRKEYEASNPAVSFDAMAAQVKAKVFDQTVHPLLIEMGWVCPAFAYAAGKSDFSYGRPWRSGGVDLVSKGEMELRKKEWNGFVDDYIHGIHGVAVKVCGFGENSDIDFRRLDIRNPLEIARSCKISLSGCPMYCKCGNEACEKMETEIPDKKERQFNVCGKCKITPYCSAECAKADWKRHKKGICCTAAAEPLNDNQKGYANVLRIVEMVGAGADLMRTCLDESKRMGYGPFVWESWTENGQRMLQEEAEDE